MESNINKSYSKIIDYIELLISIIKKKIEKSIRFELMLVIAICFIISFFFYSFTNNFLKREYTEPQISYDYDAVERLASDLANEIESQNIIISDKDVIDEILSTHGQFQSLDALYISFLLQHLFFHN